MRRFMTQPWPPVLFGEGASREIGAHCVRLGARRVLAVYDKSLYATGIVEPILKTIEDQSGLVLERFDGIEPESPDYVVEALGETTIISIKVGETLLRAECDGHQTHWITDSPVYFHLPTEHVHLFDGASGLRIVPAGEEPVS